MRRARAIITGRVQGVSYRASTVDEARAIGGITGWVKNCADGSVMLEVEGAPAAVAALLAWCEHGPPSARVVHVSIEELAPTGAQTDFQAVR
ncbi:MAG TPA: acylphosphatase [Kofleriaceae bacterium]